MSRASTLAKAIGADGAIAVSGNTTLGDASTDTVTFNAATASIPNNINFSGGNFGIGTSSPSFQLDLGNGTSVSTRLRLQRGSDDPNQYMTLGWNSINAHRASTALSSPQTDIFFNQVGSDGTRTAMYISTAGNVGVGTTSPWSKFSVYGTGNQFASLTSPSGSTTQVGVNLNPSMTAAEAAANPAQAAIYAVDSNYSANIIFANKTTGAIGNALTERMRIDTSGSVVLKQPTSTTTGPGIITDTDNLSGIRLYGASNGNLTFFTNTNSSSYGNIIFQTNNGTLAERARIDYNGNLSLATGNLVLANGKGIDFSATANAATGSMTSELLNDYEEGNWNPVIGGTGGASGQSYSSQGGRYTKIGNVVTVSGYFTLATKGTAIGSYMCITGLPFASVLDGQISVGYWGNFANNHTFVGGYTSGSLIVLTASNGQQSALTVSGMPQTDIANSCFLSVSVTYITS